jgi:O-antigen/teichoic acid export membrane protein
MSHQVTSTQYAMATSWKFIELFARRGFSIIVSIVLARMLDPKAYGLLAIITVFIAFSDVFITHGFNVALIRKPETSEKDYNTAFTISFVFALLLCVTIYLCAERISVFYGAPEVEELLKILVFIFFINSAAVIVKAYAIKQLKFQITSMAALISSLISGAISLILAYYDFGVWALVIQQISYFSLELLLLIFLLNFKIAFGWSKDSAQYLLSFSKSVIGASLLDFAGNSCTNVLLGRMYSLQDLGYYNRGGMLPEVVGLNTYYAINNALLPTLTSRQNDERIFRQTIRRIISITMYVMLPLMLGLFAISESIMPVLFTDRWNNSINIMRILCLAYLINTIRMITYNVLYVRGESAICLKVDVVRFVLIIVCIPLAVYFFYPNIAIIAFINLLVGLIVLSICVVILNHKIHYTFSEMLSDTVSSIWMGLIMVIFVNIIKLLEMPPFFESVVSIIVGASIYLALSIASNNENFILIRTLVLRMLAK